MQIVVLGSSVVSVRASRTEGNGSLADFLNGAVGVCFAVVVLGVPNGLRLAVFESDHVVFPDYVSIVLSCMIEGGSTSLLDGSRPHDLEQRGLCCRYRST